MEYTTPISLMTSDGMYSKVFAAWPHMLYAQLAGHCVHFLNVHSTPQLGVETTRLSNAFHVSPA
jgi:hypothetical protein